MKKPTIGIVGLGYVGLPLAHAFSSHYKVVGFDISQTRIDALRKGIDITLELTSSQLYEALSNEMIFTTDIAKMAECNIYIITVPTPINSHNAPDLTPLKKASETVGKLLTKEDIVIYESTVYPGATEEVCVPILEKFSKLIFNQDFFCGYSPERINPGDKEHTVTKILKVTSGSTPQTAQTVNNLYKSVITAGTYLAPSIKVAESAKVIENSQRDINIAFVNELAIIFNRLGIDTQEVLETAGTKWNFLPFRPGLVGGHCIGVDPYYLTYKAQEVGYNPEIILAGRRLNDAMGLYVSHRVIKLMIKKGQKIEGAKVLVLGITFKENCPDIRNSRVIDVVREMESFGTIVDVYDPWAEAKEVEREYNLSLIEEIDLASYQAIILAVAHDKFNTLSLETTPHQVLFDIKSFIKKGRADGRL